MIPATTPRMVKGSISTWVCCLVIRLGLKAINELSYSFTSKNSMTPLLTKSSNEKISFFKFSTISSVSNILPSSTIKRGLTKRPESVLIIIYPYSYFARLINATLTNFYNKPFLRMSLILRTKFVLTVYLIREPSTITLYPFPCRVFP